MYATGGLAPSRLTSQAGQVEVFRHQRVHPSALLRVCDLDAVMVDEVFRFLDPRRPTVGANACQYPLTSGAGERCLIEAWGKSLAAGAGDIGHCLQE